MAKKRNVGMYLAYFFLAIAICVPAVWFRGDLRIGDSDKGLSAAEGTLFAQGMKSKIADILSVMDIAEEAASKGFKITQVPQQLFARFDVIATGMKVASIPVPLSGSTTEGVVFIETILPLGVPKEGSSIYIWKNGKELPVSRTAQAESDVSVQLPLDKGTNYLCFLVKSGNSWWGRSRVLKVESPGAVIEEKKVVPPPPPSFSDYWDEANEKKYSMPKKDSIIGFAGFTITSRGSVVTDIPSPLNGSTGEGIVDSNLLLPGDLPGNNNQVFLWNNGDEILIDRNGRSNERIISKIVLGRGPNYICGIVKNGARYIGRTPMVKVDSTVRTSIARFEMTWDGPGDMDLHLESADSGWHCGFMRSNIDESGYRVNLDIDNMNGFGPENIRMFSVPSASTVKCFVNFYSGQSPAKVTVRYFDKDNKMVKSESKSFSPGMTQPTSQFNQRSWLVGTFNITP